MGGVFDATQSNKEHAALTVLGKRVDLGSSSELQVALKVICFRGGCVAQSAECLSLGFWFSS